MKERIKSAMHITYGTVNAEKADNAAGNFSCPYKTCT